MAILRSVPKAEEPSAVQDEEDYVPEPPPWMLDDEPATSAQQATSKTDAWQELEVPSIFGRLEPIRYLLAPLDMCAGAPVLVCGYGFSGKTVALQSLALSIASGLPVWGTFTAPLGRVLHVDYEQGARLTRERYQRLAAGLMLGPADLGDRLRLVSMPQVYMDSAYAESFLIERCAGFDLMLVDSFRAAAPNIEENDSAARLVLDMLARVSEKTGCVVTVIHHARKPQRDAPGGARMAIRGSGALYDASASVLVFDGEGGGQPTTVSHVKARASGRLAEDFLLRIEDVEIDGNPRGGLVVRTERVSSTRPEGSAGKALDALKERIRVYLREHGDQPGKNAFRSRIGVNRDAFYAAMAELEASGEVENTGSQQRPNLRLVEVKKP